MELVTQIVILATALVGLYKAATFHRSAPSTGNAGEGKPTTMKKRPSAFSDLFELLGVLLFMLAFPAFIWAFSWITSNVATSSSSESKTETEINIPFEVTRESTHSELMYVAASKIPNTHTRGEALTTAVTHALSNKEYRVAILAAAAIPNTYTRGEQLERVIKMMNETQSETAMNSPNKRLEPTSGTLARPSPAQP